MSESKAVFVSYASEDVDAALKIATALRASGIGTWFDHSELRGGDAWDHKIRQQIRDCTLFIPIISAATEARTEGYFRLEWHLAHERTHLIGRNKPFLLPICIDDTDERDADVPESFAAAQWTRLPGGEADETFAVRVAALLGTEHTPARARTASASAAPRARRAAWLAGIAAAIVIVGVIAWLGWPATKPPAGSAAAPNPGAGQFKSLAVLPLENLSGDPDQEYFADGMTEELITDLANIGALKVISRTSIMHYKGTEKPLPQIAQELHVDAIIEGSVQREQGRVRITAQLIDGRTDQNVWAQHYDRDLRSVLALQADIASAIAAKVRVALTPAERQRLAGARSVNPEAYDAYLKGMFFVNKMNPEGFDKGIEYMQQAIGIDPTNPLPYAGLALVYCRIGHDRFPDAFSRAEAASDKALELGGTLAETQLALGEIKLYRDWDLAAAAADLRSALDLDPSLAEAHRNYSWYLDSVGRTDEAVIEMKRAEDTDPLSAQWAADLGWQYWSLRQYDKAIAEIHKALELSPDFGFGEAVLGFVYADQGKYQDAVKIARKAAADDAVWAWPLGIIYARAGRADEAQALAAQLQKKPTPMNAWGLSEIYAALGDKDRAFQWLDKAAKLRMSYMPWLKRDPMLGPLRSDPRFERFLGLVKFPAAAAR